MVQAPRKGIARSLTAWFRKLVARPAAEFSRTGKIARTLYDATRLQKRKDRYFQEIGLIAAKLNREGKLKDLRIERLLSKIEKVDHNLDRQESLMKSYQTRGDIQGTLRSEDLGENRPTKEPTS